VKKCKVCKSEFKPTYNTTQALCSGACALASVRQKASKVIKKDLKQRRESLKTLGDHKRELQTVFNKFIRLRDKDKPCISCQRHHTGQYHAGHYLSVGARPNLRYNEINVHKQCAPCNNHLSGNPINYRINLVNLIGLDAVELLECDHEPKNYRIDDITQMKKDYRAKIKEI